TYSAFALLHVDQELDQSQWASARVHLGPILRIRPNFTLALSARGQAEAGLGDTTAALADYDRVLTRAPDYLPTRGARGELYQSPAKTKRAAPDSAFVYNAAPSSHKWAEVVALVRQIDHSTPPPPKAHKHPSKRRHEPSADAAPPPESSPEPAEQPPETT